MVVQDLTAWWMAVTAVAPRQLNAEFPAAIARRLFDRHARQPSGLQRQGQPVPQHRVSPTSPAGGGC
jgi:hypothetical protein